MRPALILTLSLIAIGLVNVGCGGGGDQMTAPRWGEVEVFRGEVDGVAMGAHMSAAMLSGSDGDNPDQPTERSEPQWANQSVREMGPVMAQQAEDLQANIPEHLKGNAAVKSAVDKVVAAARSFNEATESGDAAVIEQTYKELQKATNDLAAVPGVLPEG